MPHNESLHTRILSFLYEWVQTNKIPQIKKGMLEDLDRFIAKELAALETRQMAERMQGRSTIAAQEKIKNEVKKETKEEINEKDS